MLSVKKQMTHSSVGSCHHCRGSCRHLLNVLSVLSILGYVSLKAPRLLDMTREKIGGSVKSADILSGNWCRHCPPQGKVTVVNTLKILYLLISHMFNL